MRLDIERNNSYNCFQNQVAAIANYYQTDYKMMMLELWGFVYDRNNSSLGERMGLIWMGELEYRKKLLSNFHGISYIKYNSIRDIEKIEKLVKKNPIAFYIDSFDCEWLPFYHKQHRQHMCNIVDIDEDYCYCQDDYLNKKEYKIFKVEDIDRITNSLLVFSYNQDIKSSKHKFFEVIDQAVRRYDNNRCLEKMKMFAEDFSEEFILDKEFVEGDDPLCSKIIMYLKGLGDDKKNLLELFEYLKNNLGIPIEKVQLILNGQSKKYYSMRNYLIKMCFNKKKINPTILRGNLEALLDYEYMLYEYFTNLLV